VGTPLSRVIGFAKGAAAVASKSLPNPLTYYPPYGFVTIKRLTSPSVFRKRFLALSLYTRQHHDSECSGGLSN
jgi:hypothetical protein